MESIYPPERFKATENVDLSKYLKEFSNSISAYLSTSTTPGTTSNEDVVQKACNDESDLEFENVKAAMGIDISPKKHKTLEKECSIDLLLCEGEVKKRQFEKPLKYSLRGMIFGELPFRDQNSELEVLKQKSKIEKVRNCEKLILMNKENFHNPVIEEEEEKCIPKDITPGSDFVMNIFFYKPFSYNFLIKNYSEKFRFSHEIQMLGRNTLAELRDTITCISDAGIQAEVESTTTDISHLYKAKERYPSASFFIDGVFYNDMRSPRATDYSEEIIKWAKTRHVGTFTSADMDSTRLDSLSPRFGYPYIYLHQGDCEHVMVFADAHILTVNDCLISHQYPRMYAMNKSIGIMCYMCNIYTAKWLVKDYDRLPQSSTFFCTKCTQSYCYKDGTKIGEFKLYPLFNQYIDSFVTGDECSASNTAVS